MKIDYSPILAWQSESSRGSIHKPKYRWVPLGSSQNSFQLWTRGASKQRPVSTHFCQQNLSLYHNGWASHGIISEGILLATKAMLRLGHFQVLQLHHSRVHQSPNSAGNDVDWIWLLMGCRSQPGTQRVCFFFSSTRTIWQVYGIDYLQNTFRSWFLVQ